MEPQDTEPGVWAVRGGQDVLPGPTPGKDVALAKLLGLEGASYPLLWAASPRDFCWAFHACLKNKGKKKSSFLTLSQTSMMEMIAFAPAFSGRFQYRAKGGPSQETSGGWEPD